MDKEKQKIGKNATIVLGGLEFIVKILDVKFSYGTFRYKITPMSGAGETWVRNLKVIK